MIGLIDCSIKTIIKAGGCNGGGGGVCLHIPNWHNEMAVNSHCVSYQLFKDNLRLAPYNYNVIEYMSEYYNV